MDNNSINKYIQRLEQLQNLYKKGEGQHNAFGIAINEAKEMLVAKNESLHDFSQHRELCEGKCGMSYCDDNGCIDRKRILVEPKDKPEHCG